MDLEVAVAVVVATYRVEHELFGLDPSHDNFL